jgi:glycosyltransferase involved in cell wall biosynthesis
MQQIIGKGINHIKYIYWFAYYNEDSPSVRYRALYPLEYFKKHHNISSKLITPGYKPKKVWLFVKSYCSALFFRKKNAAIVIQRVQSNFIYSALLKLLVTLHKNNTIYDLDDADYLDSRPNSIYYFAKQCSRLALGSQAIANHLFPLNNNIVITSSPTPDLNIVKQNRNNIFTIGWIGGFGGDHKKSLIAFVFPAINQLNFSCKFILLGVRHQADREFICEYFGNNKNVLIETPEEIDWKNEQSIQEQITRFDIGIATLMDNEIQRSKSGIKAKQYLNNGVPVLGTNLPENDWVIKEGVNGYFCANTHEFKQRMCEFKNMSDAEYNSFSKNARETISEFNHQTYYNQFMGIAKPQVVKQNEELFEVINYA